MTSLLSFIFAQSLLDQTDIIRDLIFVYDSLFEGQDMFMVKERRADYVRLFSLGEQLITVNRASLNLLIAIAMSLSYAQSHKELLTPNDIGDLNKMIKIQLEIVTNQQE